MKFGHLLQSAAREMPELKGVWLLYKQLKKQIKKLTVQGHIPGDMREPFFPEAEFVECLESHVQQLNDVFVEREEELVIKLERLQFEVGRAHTQDDRISVFRGCIELHGQALLNIHWSVLAYTAVVKILKKYHKRTGLLVRAPQLRNLLSQPFCSTETLTEIVTKLESEIAGLQPELHSDMETVAYKPPASAPCNISPQDSMDTDRAFSISSLHSSLRGLNFENIEDSDDTPSPSADTALDTDDDGVEVSSVTSTARNLDHVKAEIESTQSIQFQQFPAYTNVLLQQTHTALQTWEHLKNNVSTPSTLVAVGPPRPQH